MSPRGIPNKQVEEVEEIGEVPEGLGHPPVENSEIIEEVADMLSRTEEKLLSVMSSLNSRLEALEVKPVIESPAPVTQTLGSVDNKCPEDIRTLVDKMISPKCIVRVEDSKVSPTFTVHVTLPRELQTEENDTRSKTVSYAEGITAIQEWLEKVKRNIWEYFKSRGESVPLIK